MNVRHIARTYEKPERFNVRVLVRETGLEPYSVERKPLGNRAFLKACVMICVMSVIQRQTSLSSKPAYEMLRVASDRVRSVNGNAFEKAEANLK